MTHAPHDPARDTIGRFAPQDHTAPELALTEAYLEDQSDGSDFDVHDFYDVEHADSFNTWADDHEHENAHDATGVDAEDLFSAWLEESRTPQGMEEYFDRPNPALAVTASGDELLVGAWGTAKPF